MKLAVSIRLIKGPGDEERIADVAAHVPVNFTVDQAAAEHAGEYALELMRVHYASKVKRYQSKLP